MKIEDLQKQISLCHYDTQYITVENEWIEKAKRHLERAISALGKAKEVEK